MNFALLNFYFIIWTMLNLKKYFFLFIAVFPFVPVFVLAAERPKNFGELIGVFTGLLGLIIPVLFSLAILLFLIGVTKYINKTGEEAQREEAKQFMFWGIIGLFVMATFMGLVSMLGNTFFEIERGGEEYEKMYTI